MTVLETRQEAERGGPELPPAIGARLAGLRAHLRRIAVFHGAARLVVAAAGFVLATFLLDRFLDLPAPFRLVLLAGGAAAIGWVAVRFIARPLARAPDDDAVALRVEREYPELEDVLISAVQLAKLPPERRGHHSPALVREVIEAAAERARGIDFERVAGTAELRRFGLLTLVVAGAVAGLFLAEPRDARIWVERMLLLGDTPWPRTVELAVATQPSPAVIARGEDLVVTARLLAGAPSRVVVEPRFEKTGRADEVPMVQMRDGFRAVFENVNEPFTFTVEGGDYRSQRFSVVVKERPKIEDISVFVELPAYTGIAAPKDPQKDGNLKVPAGTRVRYEARASEPLREAAVRFEKEAAVEVVKPAALTGGRTIAGEFVVRDATGWSFRLVSQESFESPAAAQYAIRVIPDRLPEVRIERPGRNKDVTREAVLPLRAEVRDDYRPLGAALVATIARAGKPAGPAAPGAAPAPPEERRIPLAGLPAEDAAAKQATLTLDLPLGDLGLQPGDVLTYWVEAVDNRAPSADTTSVAPESRGRSEKYQLRVVSDEELSRALQARLKRLRDELLQTARAQKATRDDIEGLGQELEARKPLEARDRRRLTYGELDQRKIGQRIERASQEFADVRGEMAANKVGKEEDLRWLDELAATTAGIAKGPAERATKLLQELRQAEAPEAAKLAEAVGLEGEVYDALNEIVRRLDKWDEFNEVLRDLRDLLQLEERIRAETQSRFNQDQPR